MRAEMFIWYSYLYKQLSGVDTAYGERGVKEVDGMYELEKTRLTQEQYDSMLKTIEQK